MAIYGDGKHNGNMEYTPNRVITVDITYRLTIEMAPGDNPQELLLDMDADFAWPESQAQVTDYEILDREWWEN